MTILFQILAVVALVSAFVVLFKAMSDEDEEKKRLEDPFFRRRE